MSEVISAQKTTLRMVKPVKQRGWHQDARVFVDDVHALNVWMPFSRCGQDAATRFCSTRC